MKTKSDKMTELIIEASTTIAKNIQKNAKTMQLPELMMSVEILAQKYAQKARLIAKKEK